MIKIIISVNIQNGIKKMTIITVKLQNMSDNVLILSSNDIIPRKNGTKIKINVVIKITKNILSILLNSIHIYIKQYIPICILAKWLFYSKWFSIASPKM